MNITQLKKYCNSYLAPYLDNTALPSLTKRFLEGIYGITSRDFILNPSLEVEVNPNALNSMLDRLAAQEPIQYILGFEEFCSLKIAVKRGVLIPRPETEELVGIIIDKNRGLKGGNILDMGTGSGAIAIALAKAFNQCLVEGWDIGEIPLEVANKNKESHKVDNLTIKRKDILKLECSTFSKQFDIIVSNPPYVTNSEKGLMASNVLDYEPELALFVDDSDPLLFYRTITLNATKLLRYGGRLYFEINENFGEQTAQLLIENGFKNVEIVKDFRDNNRFVWGEYYG